MHIWKALGTRVAIAIFFHVGRKEYLDVLFEAAFTCFLFLKNIIEIFCLNFCCIAT